VRAPNGGSLKNFADLKHHWIDLYVDYTGTCCQYFNIDHRNKTPIELMAELNKFGSSIGLRWLNRLGASENYCLVIRRSIAESFSIRTIADLARHAGSLTFSADPEFLNRRDCFVGLNAVYDMAFRRIEPCRVTNRYELLADEQADVFVGYETDQEIQSPQLVVLQDSDNFFPEYHALPVVTTAVLQHVPGLESALNDLDGIVSTADLVEAVRKLQLRGQRPVVVRELAEQFLVERSGKRKQAFS
jgi:osmoprotectant transport system permease protein